MSDRPLPRRGNNAPPVDYTDVGEAQQRASEADMREARLRDVEAAILSTQGGREWLWGLLAGLHVFEQRIAVTGSEYENGVYAGEHFAGTNIMRRFAKVSPANFALMFVEQDRG